MVDGVNPFCDSPFTIFHLPFTIRGDQETRSRGRAGVSNRSQWKLRTSLISSRAESET